MSSFNNYVEVFSMNYNLINLYIFMANMPVQLILDILKPCEMSQDKSLKNLSGYILLYLQGTFSTILQHLF
jgi:hypothetical protein